MAAAQATRKPRTIRATAATSGPKSGSSPTEAAKLQRAREMLRELRIDAEALLANAERRLARLS